MASCVGISPLLVSRQFALVHIAMHDALNSIKPIYKTYASDVIDKMQMQMLP
jgi:hypothetical protein